MKKIKTFMVTFLAMMLVFGSTMTAFAAEEKVIGTTTEDAAAIENGSKQEELPVYMSYSTKKASEAGKNDADEHIFNILIEYDELVFSYEADEILWDTGALRYDVRLTNDSEQSKEISVTNRSNCGVKMSPWLTAINNPPKDEGIKFTANLLRNGNDLLMVFDSEKNGSSIPLSVPDDRITDYNDCLLYYGDVVENSVNLRVTVTDVNIPLVKGFDKRQITNLQLDFAACDIAYEDDQF